MTIGQQLGGNVALDNVEHAKQALARSDLGQALFHISSALATDPTSKEWRAILDQVLSKAPDPMVFVRPEEAKADFITAATRAYVLAWRHQWPEAIATIADVIAVRPDCAYLVWAREWLQYDGVAQSLPEKDLEERIVPRILAAVTSAPAPCPPDDPRRANCDAAADVLGMFYRVHPQNAFVIFGIGVTLRRVGKLDEAIQYAGYAFQLKNDWNTCIGVANAFRDAKRLEEAAQYYRHAMTLRPDEVAPLLDLGDMYLDAQKWDLAVATYQEVLAAKPEHPWAKASLAYAQLKKTNDPPHQTALWEMSDAIPRARTLMLKLFGDKPYVTWLPGAGDSTAWAARDLFHQLTHNPPPPTGLGIDIPLTYMEAPSALLAFQLWTRAKGWNNVGIAAKVESVQQPDPRMPRAQVDFALWAYDDKVPRPNAPAPDPRLHQAIAEIASRPYCLPLWDPMAKQLGAQLGVPWMNQLLCVMVNPPPLKSPDRDPIDWVMRCQIATAMVIAHLDQGWEQSQRKRALCSIAFGPTDWICDAAIIAMGWLAMNDATIRKDIEAIFAQLEKQIPQQGFTCWEYPLVNMWRALGAHDEATQKHLDNWKKRCESQQIEFAQEKHGGLTLEQYAELAALRDSVLMKQGGGIGSAALAMVGGGAHPELAALCKRFGIPAPMNNAAARIPAWDERLNNDPALHKRFVDLMARFSLKLSGIDGSSHEGRVAQQIRQGVFDVESAKQNQMAAAQAIAQGEGGDPDPTVFPGSKLAKLSDYVGLMKAMQGGDMNGALKKYGLDMGSYMQASQAWGIKLASDPTLTAKFGQMMAQR